MRIPLPAYEPDKPQLDTGITDTALNVYPGSSCYTPVPALTILDSTVALAGAPLGFIRVKSSAGVTTHFAAASSGGVERIYYYNTATAAWVDCSFAGGYAAADLESGWQFAQYGNYVYAASGTNNDIQKIDLANIAAGFAAVAGTGGTNPPRARYIRVVKENVILGALASNPAMVEWSEFGDADGWRIGTNGCDGQEFPDSGPVTGLTGGEVGTVFQEACYRRMQFDAGSPFLYTFTRIAENHGAPAPQSIVAVGTRVFWLASDGFWMDAGEGPQPIGRERVDREFLDNVRVDTYGQIVSVADPKNTRVLWAYPTSSQSDPTVRNLVLVYDYVLDRWSQIETDLTYICTVEPPSASIDTAPLATMSLEVITPSLDSPYWSGGEAILAGFTTAYKLALFAGANLEATVISGLMQAAPPGRAKVTRAAPLVDGAALVNVATRHVITGTDTWRTERMPSSVTGYCHFEASGRYHRLKVRIAAGTTWSKAQGFEADAVPEGVYA